MMEPDIHPFKMKYVGALLSGAVEVCVTFLWHWAARWHGDTFPPAWRWHSIFFSAWLTDGRCFLCGQVILLDCTAPAASGMQGILPATSPRWRSCRCPRRCRSQPSPWSSSTPSVLWVSVPSLASQQTSPAGHFRVAWPATVTCPCCGMGWQYLGMVTGLGRRFWRASCGLPVPYKKGEKGIFYMARSPQDSGNDYKLVAGLGRNSCEGGEALPQIAQRGWDCPMVPGSVRGQAGTSWNSGMCPWTGNLSSHCQPKSFCDSAAVVSITLFHAACFSIPIPNTHLILVENFFVLMTWKCSPASLALSSPQSHQETHPTAGHCSHSTCEWHGISPAHGWETFRPPQLKNLMQQVFLWQFLCVGVVHEW